MESAGTQSGALFTAVCGAATGHLSPLLPGRTGKPEQSDRASSRGTRGHGAQGHPEIPGEKRLQGGWGAGRCELTVFPLSASAVFAEGMKKVINFKKIKREQL